MEIPTFILLGVITTCFIQTVDNAPEDPRNFMFPTGRRPSVRIQESNVCLAPNVSSTKFEVKLPANDGSSRLKPLYILCYDKYSNIPLVSKHQVPPQVFQDSFTSSLSNVKFTDDLLVKPSQFYDCAYQERHFIGILGPQNYISCNAGTYFSATNLVPASDFPFDQEKKLTQYLINTFPLWERIKISNWKSLEKSIQKYVNILGRPLEITSGTLGVTTLPDRAQRKWPLYLTTTRANMPTLPAPKLVWKMVYDSRKFETIIFVLVNNPYRQEIPDLFRNDEVVCNCVCDQTEGWFDGWNRTEFSQGYIYCCTGAEFRNNIGADSVASAKLMRRRGS